MRPGTLLQWVRSLASWGPSEAVPLLRYLAFEFGHQPAHRDLLAVLAQLSHQYQYQWLFFVEFIWINKLYTNAGFLEWLLVMLVQHWSGWLSLSTFIIWPKIWELGFHSSSLGLELCKHFCDSGNPYRALIFLLSLLIISTTGIVMLLGQPVACEIVWMTSWINYYINTLLNICCYLSQCAVVGYTCHVQLESTGLALSLGRELDIIIMELLWLCWYGKVSSVPRLNRNLYNDHEFGIYTGYNWMLNDKIVLDFSLVMLS